MAVRIRLDDAAFRALNGPAGPIGRGVQRAAGRARDRAKQNITSAGRVDTGALRQSIRSEGPVRESINGVFWQVGSDLPYAIYQHQGVRGPVLPRRAKFLRFKPKGVNTFIFARSTKGFKGVPYLTDALRSLQPSDFKAD